MTSTDAIGESLELEVCEFYGFHVEDWQRGCVWFNVGGKVLLFSSLCTLFGWLGFSAWRVCVAIVSRYPDYCACAWHGRAMGVLCHVMHGRNRIASASLGGKLCAGLCEASLLRGFMLRAFVAAGDCVS